MKRISILALTGLVFYSCNNALPDQIAGTYANEYSWQRKNLNDESFIETVTLRDTFIITRKSEGYGIENHVWRMENYADTLFHKDRGMPTMVMTYDKTDQSLNPELSGLFSPLYLNVKEGLLFKEKGGREWKKIE